MKKNGEVMEVKTFIQCQSCGSLNRVPVDKLQLQGHCGRCAKSLQHHVGIVDLQEKNFPKLLEKSPIPVIVDFWASWCGPCQYFAPIFSQVAQKFYGRMIFIKMDTEANLQVPSQLGIRSIPTLIVFKGGKVAERVSGAMDALQLEQFLNSHLK